MPDYKAMYLKMARATEESVRILIQAQRDAEEIYLSEPAPKLRVIQPTEQEEYNDTK